MLEDWIFAGLFILFLGIFLYNIYRAAQNLISKSRKPKS
jgi:hypothetical protein